MDRRAARVVLLDEEGRVLLIRGTDRTAPEHGSWWLAPGGGIEAGETPAQAAAREAWEETGFVVDPVALGDPVWERVAEFVFEGEAFRQTEAWFLARVRSGPVRPGAPTEQEVRSTLDVRWWSVDDLVATEEVVHPGDLGERLRALGGPHAVTGSSGR